MTYSSRLSDACTGRCAADWDTVCRASSADLFASREFVSVVQESFAGQARVWYVVIYQDDVRPVACAAVCLFPVDLSLLAQGAARRVVERLGRLLPRVTRLQTLIGGLPVSVGRKQLAIAPGADPRAVFEELDRVLVSLARREGARMIALKEFSAADCASMTSLAALGYRRADSLAMNHFEHRFSDFDAYLGALRGNYRRVVRRSRKKADEGGLRTVSLVGPDELERVYTPALHLMYEAVAKQSETVLEILPREFFLLLARRFPERVRLTLLVQGERALAFSWDLLSDDRYYCLFIGLDYERNAELDLYFNLMYEVLDEALRSGARSYQVGQTSDDFKSRLGCRQEPLYVFVKPVGPVSSAVFRLGFEALYPPQPATPAHHVFAAERPAGSLGSDETQVAPKLLDGRDRPSQ